MLFATTPITGTETTWLNAMHLSAHGEDGSPDLALQLLVGPGSKDRASNSPHNPITKESCYHHTEVTG